MIQPSAGGIPPKPRKKAAKKIVVDQTVTKQRIEVTPEGPKVLSEKAGPVTLVDKIKQYYHTVIIILTGVVAFLSQVGPIAQHLPQGQVKDYITAGILFLGALLTFLKSNETWVNNL